MTTTSTTTNDKNRKKPTLSQTIDQVMTIKTHTESSKTELSSRGKRLFKVWRFFHPSGVLINCLPINCQNLVSGKSSKLASAIIELKQSNSTRLKHYIVICGKKADGSTLRTYGRTATTNFERPFTPLTPLRSARNFGNAHFGRFATFDFSTPKTNFGFGNQFFIIFGRFLRS